MVSPVVVTRSAVFFPLVGWLIGLLMAALSLLLSGLGMTPLPAAVLLVAFEAWMTRGLHLDGVADLADGLGGSFDRGKRLAIMKDSATGAFGVVALVLTLFAKTAALAAILEIAGRMPGSVLFSIFFVLAFVPAASRWAMASLAWRSRYPREIGTGHAFVGKVTPHMLFAGFLFLLPVLAVLPWAATGFFQIAVVFVCSCLPSVCLRFHAHNVFGGVTGDVLGASCEFGEALGWIALALILSS